MPAVALPGKNLPLPVQLFSAAMEQQVSLAAYASHVGLAIERMYEALTTQPNELQTDMLESLARTYHQSADALRSTPTVASSDETFGAWLKRNMEGVSQHALRKRAQVETRELKEFLNETTLPDSDQAERLARALYINRTEVARTIVADMLRRAGQDRQATIAASHARAVVPEQSPARTRRRSAARGRDQETSASLAQPAQTSADSEPAATPPIEIPIDRAPPESKPAKLARARRQSPLPAAGNVIEAPDRNAGLPAQSAAFAESEPVEHRKAASREEVAPEANGAAELQGVNLIGAGSAPAPSKPARSIANSRAEEVASAAKQLEAAAGATQPLEKSTARHARADRPRNGAFSDLAPAQARGIAPAEAKTARGSNGLRHAADAAGQAAGAEAIAAPAEANTAAEPNTTSARAARPKKPGAQAGSSSQDQTTQAVQASNLRPAEASALPAAPALDQTPTKAVAGPKRALTAAEAQAKPEPIPAHGPSNQTTIELSEEEIRLLRRWRQLHPQGQRATLLYIASLLLEE